MINNRLFAIVREKQGLLYTASVSLVIPDLYDRGTGTYLEKLYLMK